MVVHSYRPGRPWGIRVGRLIAKVAAEGRAVRLGTWPAPCVPADTPPEDWPTGELPRIHDQAARTADIEDAIPPGPIKPSPHQRHGRG
jgi:hypothetical protein